jgi:hypothetical protein
VAYGAPGRPLSEPRSPFAVRRADRAAFQVLKEQARQSPAATERRARNAQKVLKTRARKKVKKLVRGEAESPFTLDQLRQLNPAEIDVLVGYVRARLDSLTPVLFRGAEPWRYGFGLAAAPPSCCQWYDEWSRVPSIGLATQVPASISSASGTTGYSFCCCLDTPSQNYHTRPKETEDTLAKLEQCPLSAQPPGLQPMVAWAGPGDQG